MEKWPDMGEQTITAYLEARRAIDPEIRLIHSLTGLLAKFEFFESDSIEIDPVSLGIINALLEQSAQNIRAALDDFLLVNTALSRRGDDHQKRS